MHRTFHYHNDNRRYSPWTDSSVTLAGVAVAFAGIVLGVLGSAFTYGIGVERRLSSVETKMDMVIRATRAQAQLKTHPAVEDFEIPAIVASGWRR